MKKLLLSIALLTMTSQAMAYCGVPPIPGGPNTDNKIYAGLKWVFNDGGKPEAVLGFRSARVNPSSYTNGGDVSISARFLGGLEFSKARLKYFSGVNTAQAEASGGYDFKNGLFVGASVNASYLNGGVDYLFKSPENSIEPYLMIDTLGKYTRPNSSHCAPIHTYNPSDGLCYYTP